MFFLTKLTRYHEALYAICVGIVKEMSKQFNFRKDLTLGADDKGEGGSGAGGTLNAQLKTGI